jgi:uncharacterized membrane protein
MSPRNDAVDYLVVKWLHILSASLMFGTGLGTAFYLFIANRSGNLQAMAVVNRWVVIADWLFTAPSMIIQPLSGWYLAVKAGWDFGINWLGVSLVLYLLAGACWLPVVWLQLQLRDMAVAATLTEEALPPRYWRYEKIWRLLGIPAFISLLIIYWLMVAKPF